MIHFLFLVLALVPLSMAKIFQATCHAINPLVTDQWCNINCNHVPSNCPPNFCVCDEALCFHNEDAPAKKCYEACSTGHEFRTNGFDEDGRCGKQYNFFEGIGWVLQCPDGKTNIKYCSDTKLNITIA